MEKKDLIYINDIAVQVKDWNLNLLQLCEEVDIIIPRFCYHDELSVAGNCRMCLIEVVNSPKPVISCGCMLTKEMKVYTNSNLVKKAREYVMEFLLINHPLDCPICDQGGECDLQDQSFVYGSDRGRFKEVKRAVEDIDLGPFIKTIMNRCIHCTRCVRFSTEILNISSLSMLGRGRESEIGTYYKQSYIHELSGNVIDLCPVGALTSKPYTFSARPWELFSMESIDVLNSFCSDIKVDVKGNEVMRILPVTDRIFETDWITDSIRFCFDGLKRDRLVNPIIYEKNENYFYSCSWEFVTYFLNKINNQNYKFYYGDSIDYGTIILLEYLKKKNIKNNISSALKNNFNHNIKEFLLSDTVLKNIEEGALLLNSLNLKQANPVLDSMLKKKTPLLKFYYLGNRSQLNYNIIHLGLNSKNLISILKGKHFFCNLFTKKIFLSSQTNKILFFMKKYFDKIGIVESNTTINQMLLSGNSEKKNVSYKKKNNHLINVFINYDKDAVNKYNSFNIYIGSHMVNTSVDCNLILPSKIFLEEEKVYYNFVGLLKKTTITLDYLDLSKSISDILLLFNPLKKEELKKLPFNFIKNNIFFYKTLNDSFYYFNRNNIRSNIINYSYTNHILTKKSVSLLKAEYEKYNDHIKNYNF